MKTICVKSFGLFLLAFSLSTAVFADDKKVDVSKSVVKWEGKKLTGAHNGTMAIKEGNLEYSNGKVTGGKVVVDMESLTVLDITDAGSNGRLVGHLKSDDFFSVAKHPISNLVITKVASNGNSHTFTGDLTIKGITNAVTFPATSSKEGSNSVYKGTVVVDRSKYDVRYGSKSFFNDIGDKAIEDNFTLDFSLVVPE